MTRPPVAASVLAAAGLGWRIDGSLPPLRDAVKEACGRPVRRVNRLIQLALIGAGRCVTGRALDPHCGLYLASGQGALQDSVDAFTQMFVDGQPPKPISFVNTLSNTACFYVARSLGLAGPNQFVSASALPFESALSLALLDLARGRVRQALVGGVDECVLPLADHRERLRTPADAPLGEGSHWLLLGAGAPEPALGRLLELQELPDRDACASWAAGLAIDARTGRVSFGAGVTAADRSWLRAVLPELEELDYRPRAAYYETVTAAGICGFLGGAGPETATLLHLNGSGDGRYAACVVQRGGAGT